MSIDNRKIVQVLLDFFYFSIISFILFYLTFDTFSYLKPSETQWFGIDNTTSYIAQLNYVSSEWVFPLLRNPEYGGPLSTSLTFTGPAPIICITMKLFAMNPEIQLFGLWILINYFLQLVFASRLLRLIGIKANFSRAFSVLFLSPFFILKTQSHFWLISHYLIIWSLYLLIFYILKDTYKAPETGALLFLSYLTNIYLLAMVLSVILLIFIIRFLSSVNSTKPIILDFFRLFGMLLIVFLTFDGIVLQDNVYQTAKTFVSSSYGYHGFNLLTFFNPDTGLLAEGFSSSDLGVIKSFSILPISFGMIPGAYEGFMYLGLGVILGLLLWALMRNKGFLTTRLAINFMQKRAIFLVSSIVTLFSISYRIGIGSIEIELPFPNTLDHLLGVFRSSGRFMWPFAYFLIFLSALGIYRWYSSRTIGLLTLGVTAGILCLHVLEIAVPLINQKLSVSHTSSKNNFEVPELKKALKVFGSYRSVRAYPQGDFLDNHYAELNYLAWKLRIPTDLHFTSRVNMSAMLEREKETLLQLCKGNLEPLTIYAVTNTRLREISGCANAPKPVLTGRYHTYFIAPKSPAD